MAPIRSFEKTSQNFKLSKSDQPLSKTEPTGTSAIKYLRGGKLLGEFLCFGKYFVLERSGI